MNKSMKDVIDSRLSYMKIDPDMKETILENTSNPTVIKTHKRLKKPLIAAVAVILCLLLSVPILGAVSEEFNNILFGISPEFAEILLPLDEECTSNGIKMEVLAATSDEEYSVVYLTLQDVEEDRLKNIGFFDSVISSCNYAATSSYDKENRTLYMRLLSEGSYDSNEPQTLILRDLDVAEASNYGLDLSEVQESAGVLYEFGIDDGNSYSYSGKNSSIVDKIIEAGKTTILQPDGNRIELPTRMQISNIGYIDNKLHIQTISPWSDKEYSSLLLTNAKGENYSMYEITTMEEIFRSPDYGFDLGSFSDDNFKCTDYVFNMTPEELVGYKLLVMENNYIKGEWNTTFRIDVYESLQIDCDVAIRNAKVTGLTISPIRMKIDYLGWGRDGEPFDVVITMKDGETIKYTIDLLNDKKIDSSEGYELADASVDIYNNGCIEMFPSIPFDVDNIAEITINNVVVT